MIAFVRSVISDSTTRGRGSRSRPRSRRARERRRCGTAVAVAMLVEALMRTSSPGRRAPPHGRPGATRSCRSSPRRRARHRRNRRTPARTPGCLAERARDLAAAEGGHDRGDLVVADFWLEDGNHERGQYRGDPRAPWQPLRPASLERVGAPTIAPMCPDARRRVFITGVGGQDGSLLAELLLDEGSDVVGICRRPPDEYPNLDGLRDRIELVQADMLDQPSIVGALRRAAPDEVYNLAVRLVRACLVARACADRGIRGRRRDGAARGDPPGRSGNPLLPGELQRDLRRAGRGAADGEHAARAAHALRRREGLRALHHPQLPATGSACSRARGSLQSRVAQATHQLRHAQGHRRGRARSSSGSRGSSARQPPRDAAIGDSRATTCARCGHAAPRTARRLRDLAGRPAHRSGLDAIAFALVDLESPTTCASSTPAARPRGAARPRRRRLPRRARRSAGSRPCPSRSSRGCSSTQTSRCCATPASAPDRPKMEHLGESV